MLLPTVLIIPTDVLLWLRVGGRKIWDSEEPSVVKSPKRGCATQVVCFQSPLFSFSKSSSVRGFSGRMETSFKCQLEAAGWVWPDLLSGFKSQSYVVMLEGLKWLSLNKATCMRTTHIKYMWKSKDVGSESVFESTNGVQFLSEGTVWHRLARSNSVQLSWDWARCGTRPVWTSHGPVWCSLFLLLLLPEALKQDSLVGGVVHSRLLQVLLSDVTGKRRGKKRESNDEELLSFLFIVALSEEIKA